jgi:hypothetical protein
MMDVLHALVNESVCPFPLQQSYLTAHSQQYHLGRQIRKIFLNLFLFLDLLNNLIQFFLLQLSIHDRESSNIL